ncbi:hypothetical protein IMSHALPRED_008870 [Imshaugia aleurites]|uniref:Uncharacterized protein n=1 Tax=Imshaugia aleurites TaxID=172621 RepID=A0A8H3G045_9LECA|nr:hypothetical protein IMSHALPRED_008870 [Imshaugia aleurites]
MRNENPARWAKWAVELQEEVHNLRHVPDLGSGTMAIIRMMKKDGVWPTEKDGVLELHHEHDE